MQAIEEYRYFARNVGRTAEPVEQQLTEKELEGEWERRKLQADVEEFRKQKAAKKQKRKRKRKLAKKSRRRNRA